MTSKIKSRFLTFLFGKDYLTDERIQAGANQAGNYCFGLIMFLLWLALLWGVIFNQIKMVIIPLIIFLLGCVSYLFFRVKNGSFQEVKNKNQSKIKKIYSYFFMGFTYTLVMFLLHLKDISVYSFYNIYPLIIKCVIEGTLFMFFFIFFMRVLIKRNNNVLNKKMGEVD